MAELGGAHTEWGQAVHACNQTHTHTAGYTRTLVWVSVLTQPHDKQRLGGSVSCLKASHGHLMQTNKQPKQSDNLQLSLPGSNNNNRNKNNNSNREYNNARQEWRHLKFFGLSTERRRKLWKHSYIFTRLACVLRWGWGCIWSLASRGCGGGEGCCCFIVCQLGDFVCIVRSSNYVFSRQTARLAGRQRDRQTEERDKQTDGRLIKIPLHEICLHFV